MVVDFQTKEKCCGCTSCVSSCPTKALSMQEDDNGFLYPVINNEICISCGLCNRVCDFNADEHFHHGTEPISAYAIKHKNDDVRAGSRSGGVFTAITDYILDNNGCVFGAAFDTDFSVRHIKCETKEQRDLLRGSKYVQSDLGSAFQDVKKELETGRMVGFSGTACQVAGLYAFLRKDYPNLITFDLICHGVPSPKLWHDYLNYIKRKYKTSIEKANFRDKQLMGWDVHVESFSTRKKKIFMRAYTELFYENCSLRESCFSCKYTNMSRPGDFTLADFWGIKKFFNDFDDNKGVSLLFINSQKAAEIFELDNVKASLEMRKCDSFEFVHPNLKSPSEKPDFYDEFWKEYKSKGIDYVIKKYSYKDFITNLKTTRRYFKLYLKRNVFHR